MRVESVVLEDHSNISVFRGNVIHELAVDIEFATRDFLKACDHTQSCRFSAA